MTTVYAERDGTRYTLFANGHATGHPEVCAAISGILYALGGYTPPVFLSGHANASMYLP